MAEITTQQKLETIVKALDSKRAEDIQAIKIGDLTIIADYFVIADGTSNIHTKALAEEVEFKMTQLGIEPSRTEGYQGQTWIVLDYVDIVVHVFYKETRDHYNLERLWSDGTAVDISQYLVKEDN
ncbi:MAG: ribosome silencing factor [Ruminococcus sp.]|nr:ribosome silencing factor [Ruminococcus sp.]